MREVVFFQAEDGIRYLVRSRGLGDVYKRQGLELASAAPDLVSKVVIFYGTGDADFSTARAAYPVSYTHLTLPTSGVDLGGRRIIKKKNSTRDLTAWDLVSTT